MIVKSVTELIAELDKAMESDELTSYICDECKFISNGDLKNELDEAASGLLIEEDGSPAYDLMLDLRKLSVGKYYVTPGEVDSFGWLTGCLHTPKGILVYG